MNDPYYEMDKDLRDRLWHELKRNLDDATKAQRFHRVEKLARMLCDLDDCVIRTRTETVKKV